jgi:hypothetical protein
MIERTTTDLHVFVFFFFTCLSLRVGVGPRTSKVLEGPCRYVEIETSS